MNAVTVTSILYVGMPASKVLELFELKLARQLRDVARLQRDCGMTENSHASYRMAQDIIRRMRTCNYTIPRHRRVRSLGWKGPVW